MKNLQRRTAQAEFVGQPKLPPCEGFNAMGKPVSFARRQAGYDHCKDMGLKSHDDRMAVVNAVANKLERDQPYEAMSEGMRYLDLTGTYRLMAVLLTPATGESK